LDGNVLNVMVFADLRRGVHAYKMFASGKRDG
jgi:hypothetical protein